MSETDISVKDWYGVTRNIAKWPDRTQWNMPGKPPRKPGRPRKDRPPLPTGRRNRIEELRLDRGLSMEELAARCHAEASTINKLEKGDMALTLEWMHRLAVALECHWAEVGEDLTVVRSEREQALLGTFRGLAEPKQQDFLETVGSVAKLIGTPDEPGKRGNGGKG